MFTSWISSFCHFVRDIMVIILNHTVVATYLYLKDRDRFKPREEARWRGAPAPGAAGMQAAILQLSGATSLTELQNLSAEALKLLLPGTDSVVVYLESEDGRCLTSSKGLLHTLPQEGLSWEVFQSRERLIKDEGLDPSDPLYGLLKADCSSQVDNATVVCSPVVEKESERVVAVLVASCDTLSSEDQIGLDILEQQFLVCFKRIKASAGRAVPTTSTRRHSEVDRDSVLQLCADLYDQESAVLQYKVLKYLQEKTHAQGGLLLLMAPDSTQLTCQVLNGKMLEEEMRFPVEQNGFGSIFHLKTACMLSDLQPDLREELNEIIGVRIQSLLCVPLFNKVTGDAQALVFMLNKTGADSFTEEDVEIIQYCFKYTATVLTSALAIQNERRLKVQTQELLRVTKNLFTHLGEYSHRGVHPFPLQSLHEAETPTPLPPAPCVSETHWANSKTSTPIAHVCDKLKHVKHDTHRQVNREARLGSACLAIVGDTDSHMVKTEAVARMVHLQHPKCPGKCFGLPTVCEKPIVKEHSSSSVTGACSLKLDLSSQLEPKIPLADEGFVNQPVAACSSNLQCREPVRSTSSTSNSSTSLPSRGRSAESVCSDIREVLNTAFLESESETSTCGELTSHPSHTSVKVYTDNLRQNEKHGACVVVIENAEENFCHQPEPVKTGDMLSGNGVKKQIAKIQVLAENGILSVGTVDKLCLASQQQQTLDVEWYRDAICILCPGPWNKNVPEENQYDLTVLLREIMQTARNLAKAERCSVFLLENDTNELVAKVFDGGADDKLQAEIRIPVTQGIAGHVATTGEILNIKDAYSHPLFYRGVDESTGFRTRNILCFPIKDETGNIVGVAQLCNKIKAPYFTAFDEEIANAFSIYCCISLVHSLLYKKVRDAQTRSKLSNELMIYHMLVSPEEIFRLACQNIPAPHVFDTSMDKFCCMPRSISEPDSPLAVLSMFQDMNLISRFKVQTKTLAKFTLMVKKGYRDPPYHNWGHAFAVAHFCYLAYKNLKLLNYITELEVFALFTACLCHDIDHRGTNNSYQVASGSVLAALYSSEGSVMERHHFAQSMCILNTEGCNIFENLTRQEYQRVLDLVRDIILATDLAHHLRILKELRAMVDGGFDKDNPQHHMLVCFLLMTACDLSDQTKSWRNSKKIAELIYGEFFSQGDLEKALGQKPLEMMDRERAYIPDLQLGFLDGIALPVFQLLAKLMPGAQEVLDAVLNNKRMWMKVDTKIQQSNCENKSSVDVFSMEIDEGEDDTVNVET